MRIRVGLENAIEGRSLAWALDHPGCFAYGTDGPSAVFNMFLAVPKYVQWLEQHTAAPWFTDTENDIRLVDTWDCYHINEQFDVVDEDQGYEVNAWFQNDWKPLTRQDLQQAQFTLAWVRQDLLAIVSGLPEALLNREVEGERWSIAGILNHIANAEWWYMDRLGLSTGTRQDLPTQGLERITLVRQQLVAILPGLLDQNKVVGKDGEFWSPRKLLRRAIWHEMNHIEHIIKLL